MGRQIETKAGKIVDFVGNECAQLTIGIVAGTVANVICKASSFGPFLKLVTVVGSSVIAQAFAGDVSRRWKEIVSISEDSVLFIKEYINNRKEPFEVEASVEEQ